MFESNKPERQNRVEAAEQAMRLIEDQSKKIQGFPCMSKEQVDRMIFSLYGQGELLDNIRYYKGDTRTANSYAMRSSPVGFYGASSALILLGDGRDERIALFNLIVENIKDRVIIDIGPSCAWVSSAIYAKKNGAIAYIGIDIDEVALKRPNLSQLKYDKLDFEYLTDFAYPVCDDPVNLLTRLENHSAVIVSSSVFDEPMDKDWQYKKKLERLISDKTIFGLHTEYPNLDPEMLLQSKYNPNLEGSSAAKTQVFIYKDPTKD